jgi:hypothetical protein
MPWLGRHAIHIPGSPQCGPFQEADMTISVISNTLASAYASKMLGPRTLQSHTAPDADDKAAQHATAGDASRTDGSGTSSADGQARSTNFRTSTGAANQASASENDGDDPTSQTIKQLERQLRQVLSQIQRLQASSIPNEQKAPQLQALNAEAATLQAQIASLLAKQAQAAKGAITA